MLLPLLAVVGFAVVVLALVLHAARNVARRHQTRKRAELIRQRLQDEPNAQRRAFREIEIRLTRS